LAGIARYIARESSRETADAFMDKIGAHCLRLASLPPRLGRPRPELGKDYRSTPFGNYMIFFRYADVEGSRSHLYIVGIVHASRDIEAHLKDHPFN
jgi:plasmid stabilization system protein ParE